MIHKTGIWGFNPSETLRIYHYSNFNQIKIFILSSSHRELSHYNIIPQQRRVTSEGPCQSWARTAVNKVPPLQRNPLNELSEKWALGVFFPFQKCSSWKGDMLCLPTPFQFGPFMIVHVISRRDFKALNNTAPVVACCC